MVYRISLIFILFLFFSRGYSDQPPIPIDFSKVTKNGEYILVMIAPMEVAYIPTELRDLYSQSGLYKNNGSVKPIWIINWYAFDVYPCSDGVHLVRMGPWASDFDQEAISFYKNGKKIRSYKINKLIKNKSKLQHTISHFSWRSKVKYFDKKFITVTTVDNNTYKFSLTGDIIK